MSGVRLSKDSEEFQMFQDFWKILQENWITEHKKEYWQRVIEETSLFYEKYGTEFSKELAVALLNELERKAKHVKEMYCDIGKERSNDCKSDKYVSNSLGRYFNGFGKQQ